MVKRSACAAGNFQKTLVKSTVSKLQKWDAPKNKSQLTSLKYAPDLGPYSDLVGGKI